MQHKLTFYIFYHFIIMNYNSWLESKIQITEVGHFLTYLNESLCKINSTQP